MTKTDVPLAIVVAVGRNGAIGHRNKLPWRIPSDLARFRALTMGKPMIMGRRTFESIGRNLPGRESVVVTRDADFSAPGGVFHAAEPEAAFELAALRAKAMGAEEIALIGGASLFAAMMPAVDRLYITYVDLAPEADVFFPPIDFAAWRETACSSPPRKPEDEAAFSFVDYVRA